MKTLVVLIGVAMFGFTGSVHARVNKGMAAEGNKHFLALAHEANLAPTSVPVHPAEALREVNAEEILEVENWMISESYFVSPVGIAESEESLNVEQWMLSDQNFSAITMEKESDNPLKVEDWMLNESVWGR